MTHMSGKHFRSQQFENRKQRRGLTEEEALAIAARARRGEKEDITRSREAAKPSPSSILHPPSSPSSPLWTCGRCFQQRAALPLTFPQHSPHCPKRGQEETE